MQGASPTAQRLESWKEIASYLKRDKRTVQRWEKEYGLPVHRLQLNTGSTVYAYPAELDAWYTERQPPNFPPDADGANALGEDNEIVHKLARGESVNVAGNAVGVDEEIPVDVSAEVPPGSNVSVEPQVNSASVTPAAESQTERAGKESQFARRRVIQLQVSVTLASVAIVAFLAYSLSSSLFRPKPPSGKIRLVVLPFTNLSGDSQQDYFSAGLTDEMITQLGRLDPQRLGVIAATSSKLLAGKPINELGRTLDVQYALEGTVRPAGSQIRIDVQLIQVSDQTHLWAASYTRDLGDILHVQDEVATAVASKISVALPVSSQGGLARPAPHPVNPEAYDDYLKGRFYWTNRSDFPKSLQAFQQALQIEPPYAQAYAGLAGAYVLLGQVPNDGLPPLEAAPKARAAAERALALDPNLGEAHAVLALIAFGFDWNFDAAEREFSRALELEPNNPTTHEWYGHYCIVRNRLPQAQEETTHALELDPVSPLFNTVRAETFYYARDYDAAIVQARRTIEQYPNFLFAHYWLGSAYREKKMYPEAVREFSEARRVSGDNPAMIAVHGHALARSGDAAGAHKALAQLQHIGQSRYVPAVYFAAIYLGLGDNAAMNWFERAYKERNDRLVYLAVDPIADPLRAEPRFRDLLRHIGLPQ